MGGSFHARYPGQCNQCGTRIFPRDLITRVSIETYSHVSCNPALAKPHKRLWGPARIPGKGIINPSGADAY
jgi:hypothetical protein